MEVQKSKELKNCPYLWEVSTGEYFSYVFAETPSEALEIAQTELTEIEEVTVKIICFANDIINYN